MTPCPLLAYALHCREMYAGKCGVSCLFFWLNLLLVYEISELTLLEAAMVTQRGQQRSETWISWEKAGSSVCCGAQDPRWAVIFLF